MLSLLTSKPGLVRTYDKCEGHAGLSVDLHEDPRPKKLQIQAILLVERIRFGPRYEKNEVASNLMSF